MDYEDGLPPSGDHRMAHCKRSVRVWAVVLAISCAACGGGAEQAPISVRSRRSGALWIAGSGGALPLARKLARAFEGRHPATRVVVHPSIGSSGAVRALDDHAIDVGLLTRPPRRAERDALSSVTPIADTHIVLVAHPDVSTDRIERSRLRDLFSGRGRWPGGGRAIPVLRETGDSSQEALWAAVPGLGATMDRMWREERYRVVWHDAELVETVVRLRGGFGVSDDGQNRCEPSGARIVTISGAPLPKRVYLALSRGARPEAAAFVAFATSPEGRAITSRCGYQLPETH